MTTPEQARRSFDRHVAENRAWFHVGELLEDECDCFAVLGLNDPEDVWPLGPGPLLVSKATGELWSDAYGAVIEKIGEMRPV